MNVTIHSSGKDPGNRGNYSRDIDVSVEDGLKGPVSIVLRDHWADGRDADFNISRAAAEKLMMALDLLLSAGEPDADEEEAA
jgi:hypothetical protein